MKPIIHNVSETTTHTHTKRFKSFLTDEQVSKHLRGLETQDELRKIPLDVREWISEFTGRLIERDYNAAWNILFWGLYPEYHYLVSTGKSAKYLSRTN